MGSEQIRIGRSAKLLSVFWFLTAFSKLIRSITIKKLKRKYVRINLIFSFCYTKGKGKMTTYWLIGEKSNRTERFQPSDYIESVAVNPSITFQGPDSPASHSLTQSQSPERKDNPKDNNHTPYEIQSERDRIKHEIASFVAKDLINNIDNAVREFRKSQSANFAIVTTTNRSVCNGNEKGLITPTYDKELVISRGKVRDVVNKLNSCVVNDITTKSVKTKGTKNED
jgi:hypothetical protein